MVNERLVHEYLDVVGFPAQSAVVLKHGNEQNRIGEILNNVQRFPSLSMQ